MASTAPAAGKPDRVAISLSLLRSTLLPVLKPVIAPVIGALSFLLLWTIASQNINTSLGQFPNAGNVAQQFSTLYQEHSREREKEQAFYERQEKRNADRVAKIRRMFRKFALTPVRKPLSTRSAPV